MAVRGQVQVLAQQQGAEVLHARRDEDLECCLHQKDLHLLETLTYRTK